MQQVKLALSLAAAFGAGVATRVLNPAYQAVDLGLEGSFLAGLVGGYSTGLMAGALISIPAMFPGEFMSMPLFAAVGVLGGLLRDIAPDKEEIWGKWLARRHRRGFLSWVVVNRLLVRYALPAAIAVHSVCRRVSEGVT